MRREVRGENGSPWKPRPVGAINDQRRALRSAIEAKQIRPYYQPIVDLRSQQITGVEALARWITANGVEVSPSEFIPMANAEGLLNQLTESLLITACCEVRRWSSTLTLAVNVSPCQFADDSLPAMMEACATSVGFPLSRLVVEITEDALQSSREKAIGITETLRGLGIRLAMDDFGIGDSNIRRLGLVEFDILKIDRCVIKTLTPEKRTQRGVIAAIAVAESLGLDVIAEGVEEQWQADLLESLGCTVVQGWLTGRPMPASEFPVFWSRLNQSLRTNRPAENSMRPWPPRSESLTRSHEDRIPAARTR